MVKSSVLSREMLEPPRLLSWPRLSRVRGLGPPWTDGAVWRSCELMGPGLYVSAVSR